MSNALSTKNVIENISNHAKQVTPGQPARFTAACQVDDQIWQGDLGIRELAKVPEGFREASLEEIQKTNPNGTTIPLVPPHPEAGDTIGSHHCLDRFEGVKVYLPPNWPKEAEEDYRGPVLEVKEERTVTHPTHGDVTLCPSRTYGLYYQRVHDAELRRARRNAD